MRQRKICEEETSCAYFNELAQTKFFEIVWCCQWKESVIHMATVVSTNTRWQIGSICDFFWLELNKTVPCTVSVTTSFLFPLETVGNELTARPRTWQSIKTVLHGNNSNRHTHVKASKEVAFKPSKLSGVLLATRDKACRNIHFDFDLVDYDSRSDDARATIVWQSCNERIPVIIPFPLFPFLKKDRFLIPFPFLGAGTCSPAINAVVQNSQHIPRSLHS